MGMSTSVVGIRPADEHFKKMLAAYEACVAAGTEPPETVRAFFNDETPDPKGVVLRLGGMYSGNDPSVTVYHDDSSEGLEIDLSKLPKDIKIIRFINSW